MEDLLRKLDKALVQARLGCSTAHPGAGIDVGYFFGERQGYARGLATALKIVENFMNETGEEEEMT